jgi:hypothetical protein
MGATDSLHIGDFSCKSSMLRSGAAFAVIHVFPNFPWFHPVSTHFDLSWSAGAASPEVIR